MSEVEKQWKFSESLRHLSHLNNAPAYDCIKKFEAFNSEMKSLRTFFTLSRYIQFGHSDLAFPLIVLDEEQVSGSCNNTACQTLPDRLGKMELSSCSNLATLASTGNLPKAAYIFKSSYLDGNASFDNLRRHTIKYVVDQELRHDDVKDGNAELVCSGGGGGRVHQIVLCWKKGANRAKDSTSGVQLGNSEKSNEETVIQFAILKEDNGMLITVEISSDLLGWLDLLHREDTTVEYPGMGSAVFA
ncbi:hypothetical protein QYF36_002827 [Acer negundo]|nr:hypothetical protein QYF36_002827 [Acer negundo]